MRQIQVEEFDFDYLPNLLRDMADWLEENKPKVWALGFDENDQDADEGEPIRWAGYIYCFPSA
jgi:hypothetical protein